MWTLVIAWSPLEDQCLRIRLKAYEEVDEEEEDAYFCKTNNWVLKSLSVRLWFPPLGLQLASMALKSWKRKRDRTIGGGV